MPVEQRDAGRWMGMNETTETNPTTVPATARHDGLRQAHVTWLKLTVTLMLHVDGLLPDSQGLASLSISRSILASFSICFINPLRGNTTNWRAGCGKSASPVRREGRPANQSAFPTPIVFILLRGLTAAVLSTLEPILTPAVQPLNYSMRSEDAIQRAFSFTNKIVALAGGACR